ncbi:MAG: hypothetical protein ACAF41_23215 [Leptolyngbya sp. BL-A-14]
MYKDKPVYGIQTKNGIIFWRIWRVGLPLGLLAASLLFGWWAITQNASVEGLVLMQLMSSWNLMKLLGTIAAVIGLAIGTIAIITKRSLVKGTLVGLEIFLNSLIGIFTGATTGSLIISAETDENTISGLMFVLFCCFVGLIIGASWQMIGWVLYQGLRKSQV